jgi:hypothetical protein
VRRVLVAFSVLHIAGCSVLGPPTSVAVVPSLDSWQHAGLSCDGPHEDGVPSGLLQWRCEGTLGGIETTANLDGDDKGVFQIVAQVAPSTDLASAIAAFGGLVDATPALAQVDEPVLAWLDKWDGTDTSGAFGTSWVRISKDPAWITFSVFPGPRRTVNDRLP